MGYVGGDCMILVMVEIFVMVLMLKLLYVRCFLIGGTTTTSSSRVERKCRSVNGFFYIFVFIVGVMNMCLVGFLKFYVWNIYVRRLLYNLLVILVRVFALSGVKTKTLVYLINSICIMGLFFLFYLCYLLWLVKVFMLFFFVCVIFFVLMNFNVLFVNTNRILYSSFAFYRSRVSLLNLIVVMDFDILMRIFVIVWGFILFVFFWVFLLIVFWICVWVLSFFDFFIVFVFLGMCWVFIFFCCIFWGICLGCFWCDSVWEWWWFCGRLGVCLVLVVGVLLICVLWCFECVGKKVFWVG